MTDDVRRANVQAKCRMIIECLQEIRTSEDTADDVRPHISDVINRCDTILTNLNPTKVALYGGTGVGKSRFINQLLQETVVTAGAQAKSSTSVVSEIVSRPDMKTYKATVYFISTRTMKEHLEYVAEMLWENRAVEGNSRLKAIMTVIRHCFSSDLSYEKPTPLTPNEENRVLLQNIGRQPLVLERDSMKELREALTIYSHLPANNAPPDQWQAVTVDFIRIEGNFEHLPSNVIVVDSPGLFDAVDMKSQRALEVVNSWQQIWFTDRTSRFLKGKQEQQAFRELCATSSRMEKVSAVCTHADDMLTTDDDDGEEPRTPADLDFDEMEATARNHIIKVLCRGDAGDVRREVHIPVGFVSNARRMEDRFGMEYWRNRLGDLGAIQGETLNAMEDALTEVIGMLETLGLRNPPPNFPQGNLDDLILNIRTKIDKLMDKYADRFSDPDKISQLYSDICDTGDWDDIHGKTWKATMDPVRRGIFKSTGRVRQYININTDISSAWVRVKDRKIQNLREHFATFRNEVRQLESQWQEQPAGFANSLRIDVDRWQNRTTEIMRHAFDVATLADQIRTDFTDENVYRSRTTHPSRGAICKQVTRLLDRQRSYRTNLLREVDALQAAILRYTQPVQELNQNTVTIITGLIDTLRRLPDQDRFYLNEDRVPVDFVCPLTLEIMNDPVLDEDGCIFERDAINRYFGNRHEAPCPLCRRIIRINNIMPHDYLRHRITLWREKNRIEEPGEWWIGLWEDIVTRIQNAEDNE